ncbi:MAG: hypothetical protein U9O56_09735 [Campylobacterota bacterium]|nr:hypothetical protein [Campylobacterota bacterium]
MENRVIKTQITTRRVEKNLIEVISGLTTSDKIVTSGVHLLKEGQKVKAYKKLGN